MVACDDYDLLSLRKNKNTLGHPVERFKARLAVRIRKEIKDQTGCEHDEKSHHEGGEFENQTTDSEIDEHGYYH